MVSGRTTLILKDPRKGLVASNYRPTTCLPTLWKLFSGILTQKILKQVNDQRILTFEQKGLQPGSRGTKNQLLIDKMIGADCKARWTNLAVSWIDFQKLTTQCLIHGFWRH